jgi:NAD(P)H dehydrogenase (quinone)
MRLLIYGASGIQGRGVAEQLLAHGDTVRIVTRAAARVAGLVAAGAQVIEAEPTDAARLRAAGRDVDAAFLQFSAAIPDATLLAIARQLLTAARDAQIPHIVVTTSTIVPERLTGLGRPDAKYRLVELIQELTPYAVVLKPTQFLENFSQGLRQAVLAGVIPYPIPADVPIAWMAVADQAAFAVAALQRPALAGQQLAIGGPEALTGPELAARFSQTLGRPVQYLPVPPAAFAQQLTPLLGADVAAALTEMLVYTGGEGAAHAAPDLAAALAALPVSLTSIDRWMAVQDWTMPGVAATDEVPS